MGKVVDLNPETRLSKEGLQMIKDLVNAMTVEDTKSITLIFKRRDDASAPQFYAYGVDMESIGATQVICQVLGQELLSRDFADISE